MMAGISTNHILVIKLSAFGDFVQALGAMAAIRRHHQNDKITLLTTAPFVELAKQSGYFNDIWVDARPRWHQPHRWISLTKKLRGGKFHRVYDLQCSDRTSFYFKLFSPRPEWVGVAKGASHRNTAPDRVRAGAFRGLIQTLRLAGINDVKIDTMTWLGDDTNLFNLTQPYVLLVPGAAPTRPLKLWPADYYGALGNVLFAKGFTPVIIGSHHEINIAATITSLCPAAVNLTGQTKMSDLPALARHASFAIGNDTGPMHMIAPTGCPSLVLFSSDSDPARHSPLGAHVETVRKDKLSDLSVEHVAGLVFAKMNKFGRAA